MSLKIEFIPITEHRWTTLGSWEEPVPGRFLITVANMRDWRHEFLILIHELVEWALCQASGIKTKECDDFDDLWEAEYACGGHSIHEEAGLDKRCPYRRGHVWGNRAERVLAFLMGVNWEAYCEACIDELKVYDAAKSR